MGSDSDWSVMSDAAQALKDFGIQYEVEVLSARGIKVIIAGAGGAAHLPGMLASVTTLPVVGVPVPLGKLDGMDSLLSIVQMPAGIPVATVSIGGAKNAGILAARILSIGDKDLEQKLVDYGISLAHIVAEKNTQLQNQIKDN
jgi:5-(carboxyamino)imidazole ribonucleotide mutase